MSRVLVTGGSGFIGTSVVARLVQERPDLVVSADLRPPPQPRAGVVEEVLDITDAGAVE